MRALGVTDPELSPNHSWRHTFKRIAEAVGITEKVHDAITGHTPATEGRKYGPPSVADMAKALKKFPRYRLSDTSSIRSKKKLRIRAGEWIEQMTDNYEEWDCEEQLAWEPKTPKEEREALGYAPLATLRATPATAQAAALMRDLASAIRGHKRQRARRTRAAKHWSLMRTRAAPSSPICLSPPRTNVARAGYGAHSTRPSTPTKYVTWTMFDGIRKAWLEAGLIEHKPGYPGMLAFGNPGPTSGKLDALPSDTEAP